MLPLIVFIEDIFLFFDIHASALVGHDWCTNVHGIPSATTSIKSSKSAGQAEVENLSRHSANDIVDSLSPSLILW
jgi:hypothetical protein